MAEEIKNQAETGAQIVTIVKKGSETTIEVEETSLIGGRGRETTAEVT